MGVIADDVADTLLHEIRNILKANYDPDSSTSTFLQNPARTPEKALERTTALYCEAEWDLDSYHRLRSVKWPTQNQQVITRQFDGVIIQDNTCLTSR